MDKLYLDNFRGFKNQVIPIKDISFLVGENSSGKSSIIYAQRMIFNDKFWFSLDFKNEEAQVFSFEDLVSAESNDKSYFKIGYIYDKDSKKPSFIFTFIGRNGKPIISETIFSQKNETIHFIEDNQKIKYNIYKDIKKEIYEINDINKKDYKEVEGSHIAFFQQPLFFVSIMNNLLKKNTTNDNYELPINKYSMIAPIRSKPQKTYDNPSTNSNPEGEHIPYEIRRILTKKEKTTFEKNINIFGKESGLYKEIAIREYDKADDAPFRMNFILNKEQINIVNIGYGVSQVLPILYEIFTGGNRFIAIQQPEVHLHPKAQASLGDLFFNYSIGENKRKMAIETHSDYIINRFRQKQKRSEIKSNAQILFFLRKDGNNKVFNIDIMENGDYDKNQPEEFREFFIQEEIKNLGL